MALRHGTHGTSRTRGDLIRRDGFRHSEAGLVGGGVYLWYDSGGDGDAELSRRLAEGWWRTMSHWDRYRGEANPGCDILECAFEAADSDILQLDGPLFAAELRRTVRRLEAIGGAAKNTTLVAHAYALIADQSERVVGRKCPIWLVQVPQPRKMDYKEGLYNGWPYAYVVRDSNVTIMIEPLRPSPELDESKAGDP